MPLLPGKENIGRNIGVEKAAGKPHKQAIAIALDKARTPGKLLGRMIKRKRELKIKL